LEKEFWFDERILGIGFGWPLTIEGWFALIGLFTTLFISAYINDLFVKRDRNDWKVLYSKKMLRFLLDLIIILSVFTALFHDRIKGGLVWNW
jgi:hypothetical protein